MENYGRVACGTTRRVQAYNLLQRNRLDSERIGGTQVVLGGEREPLYILNGFDTLRGDTQLLFSSVCGITCLQLLPLPYGQVSGYIHGAV